MQPKLGILAGGGRLPADIIDTCKRTGRPFFVVAFEDQADPELCSDTDHLVVRLGAAGRMLKALRDNGVEEIILAGSIRRPSMAALRPDMWGAKFLVRRSGIMALGDDGLLTVLVKTLESEEGFRVVGVKDVAGHLLSPLGKIGAITPTDSDKADIRTAVRAAYDLGARDAGQAAVARHGSIIGLEDEEGTDALLTKLGANQEISSRPDRSGVLAKVAKPGQERRADLPAIGVNTVINATDAGLSGIVVEAEGSIILDKENVIREADRLGLFVLGVNVEDILADG